MSDVTNLKKIKKGLNNTALPKLKIINENIFSLRKKIGLLKLCAKY